MLQNLMQKLDIKTRCCCLPKHFNGSKSESISKINVLGIYAKTNKGTDQLHGNCAADQCLCFCYIDSPIHQLQASSHLLWLYSPFIVGSGQKHGRYTCRLSPDTALITYITDG